jgi:hypothetical protein
MACDCEVCSYHKNFQAWRETLPESAKEFADELMQMYDHVADDRSYLRAIIDGSWRTADEIIKKAREYKSKNKEFWRA